MVDWQELIATGINQSEHWLLEHFGQCPLFYWDYIYTPDQISSESWVLLIKSWKTWKYRKKDAARHIFKQANCPKKIYSYALRYCQDESILSALAESEQTPQHILKKIATVRFRTEHDSLARNPTLTDEIISKIIDTRDPYVLCNLLSRPDLSPHHIRHIYEKYIPAENINVQWCIAKHNNTPLYILIDMGQRVSQAAFHLIRNPNFPQSHVQSLFKYATYEMKSRMCDNARLSARTLYDYANKVTQYHILEAILDNPKCCAKTINLIYQKLGNEKTSSYDSILNHPNTPEQLRLRIMSNITRGKYSGLKRNKKISIDCTSARRLPVADKFSTDLELLYILRDSLV